MKVIGLTGGIACGKSTVSRILAELGAQTASADEDARAVLLPGEPTLALVRAEFPNAFRSDSTLDRAALGAQIFADPAARARLEAIMHPAIFERMQATCQAARQAGPGVLVYEVPLLFEKQREGMFDAVVAVVAPPPVQAMRLQERERLAGRPELTAEAIAERLAAQLPTDEKARRADFVIRSEVSMDEMRADVARVWDALNRLPVP